MIILIMWKNTTTNLIILLNLVSMNRDYIITKIMVVKNMLWEKIVIIKLVSYVINKLIQINYISLINVVVNYIIRNVSQNTLYVSVSNVVQIIMNSILKINS